MAMGLVAGADIHTTPFMGVPKMTANASSSNGNNNNIPTDCHTLVGGIPDGNGISFPDTQNVAQKLRVMNQEYVDKCFTFSLNGECHGK